MVLLSELVDWDTPTTSSRVCRAVLYLEYDGMLIC